MRHAWLIGVVYLILQQTAAAHHVTDANGKVGNHALQETAATNTTANERRHGQRRRQRRQTARKLSCPDGLYKRGLGCLSVVDEFVTHLQGAEKCEEMGGILAEAKTKQIDDAIDEVMNSQSVTNAWIGGLQVNKKWKWIKQANMIDHQSYKHWGKGSRKAITPQKTCMIKMSSLASVPGWWDWKCTFSLPYFCQKKAGGSGISVVKRASGIFDASDVENSPTDGCPFPKGEVTKVGNECFKLMMTPTTQVAAAAVCAALGQAKLAEIKTEAEDDAIEKLMVDNDLQYAFLGAKLDDVQYQWMWPSEGVKVSDQSFTNWASGAPREKVEPRNCMVAISTASPAMAGWWDGKCDVMRQAVCHARECPVNNYGPWDCQNRCHCLGSADNCDMRTGECAKGCADGWGGKFCDERCPDNTFGRGCLKDCHCEKTKDVCNPITGHCPGGCKLGFTGPACQEVCSKNTWGPKCKNPCHCEGDAENCDVKTGECSKGCAAGWTGLACRTKCANGTFGINCTKTCHCKGQLVRCNYEDGSCIDGCAAGWQGAACQEKCPDNKFGPGCTQDCHCSDGSKCHPEDGECAQGCADGWTGSSCQKKDTKKDKTKKDKANTEDDYYKKTQHATGSAEKARQSSLVEMLIGTILTLAVGHVM